MPKREDDTYRYIHGHPISCTCVDCIRLRTLQLRVCPTCSCKSLFHNRKTHLYECLNTECKHRFTEQELSQISDLPVIPANRRAVIKQKAVQRQALVEETERKKIARHAKIRKGELIAGIVLIFFGVVSPFIWPLHFTMLIPFIPIPYAGNVFLAIAGIAFIYEARK